MLELLLLVGFGYAVWYVHRKLTASPTMTVVNLASSLSKVAATGPAGASWTPPPGGTLDLTPGGSSGVFPGGTTMYFDLPAGASWPDPVANPGMPAVTLAPGGSLTGVWQGFNANTQQPTGAQPQGTDAVMWTGLTGVGTVYFQFLLQDGSTSTYTVQFMQSSS